MTDECISVCADSELSELVDLGQCRLSRPGRRMLEYAEAQGRNRGARIARMTVVSIRAGLIAWYQRRGYRCTGETLPFPYDDARFRTPQRHDLEFVVLQKGL